MAKTYKIIILIVLTGLSIILSASICGLQLIYKQRQKVLKRYQAQMKKKSNIRDEVSHSRWNQTTKKSRPMDSQDELNLRSKAAPNTEILSAQAHLSLALQGIPFYAEGGNAVPSSADVAKIMKQDSAKECKGNPCDDKGGMKNEPIYSSIWDYAKNLLQMSNLNTEGGVFNIGHDSSGPSSHVDIRKSSLYHLQKAAELGNSEAQNIMANMLVSGILPFDDDPNLRNGLLVQKDFSEGGQQLARALMLWHLSAMDGNIEAAMSLGYRHYVSATTGSDRKTMIEESSLKPGHLSQSSKYGRTIKPMTHSTSGKHHYGILGTCESTMLYYEAAANAVMDELESSPLRGKVAPAQDYHRLAEIYQRGTSSGLSAQNKPDELDEAIKYYKMRAQKAHDPDIHAAYKIANMYHYGLRGVKQDMNQALKYYEIAADANSWEAAGQAGKFHFWSMGLGSDDRNLKKARDYFERGSPGGIEGCKRRFERKLALNSKRNSNMGIEEIIDNLMEGSVTTCDHPCLNGMGLINLFGVPMLSPVNLTLAVNYFELAKNMGNMDAYFNLAMMRLGWMNPYYSKTFTFQNYPTNSDTKELFSPSRKDYIEASLLLKRAHEMGHIQAKHRLAMLYASGVQLDGAIVIKKDCTKATSLYKEVATTLGTSISKRMRKAYKQFTFGDYESSLRNYLAAAETGSIVAQVNAAFLLERGYCLGMNRLNCMKASVRLWRAAAQQGDEEACLRVGDFYYYGRLREDANSNRIIDATTQRDADFSVSPMPWIRYILYPEDLILKLGTSFISGIRWVYDKLYGGRNSMTLGRLKEDGFCEESDGTCSRNDFQSLNGLSDHFETAIQYYRKAADDHESARAYFNLAFMHEWGLGVAKDFSLAKRYYELAAKNKESEGELAVQIASVCLSIHEFFVKLHSKVTEWSMEPQFMKIYSRPYITIDGHKSVKDVLLHHALNFDSALILFLIWVLMIIVRDVQDRRQRR